MVSLGALLLVMLLGACNERGGQSRRPVYTQHTAPSKVTISFAEAKTLPSLSMRIDHRKKRIYNASYLPYESTVDSAYLKMVLTSEATITLHNLTTGKHTQYHPTDTGKVDLTGGRLRLVIEIPKEPTLSYDVRLLTYGYDPLRYTWAKLPETTLPLIDGQVAEEAQVLRYAKGQGRAYYWLAKAGRKVELRSVDHNEAGIVFGEGMEIDTAEPLSPRTAIELHDKYWALGERGTLHSSTDLKVWHPLPVEGYQLTQILGEVSTRKSEGASISAIAEQRADRHFYILKLSLEGKVLRATELPAGKQDFPVREAFVHAYREGGLYKHNIMSGLTALGKPSSVAFFTSDGEHWGRMPYVKEGEQQLPESGALFLSDPEMKEIFVLGGVMKGTPTAMMKKSEDHGVTWKELTKEQAPGVAFHPLYNASGLVFKNSAGDPTFYIFGGKVDGEWTTQIWHGELDRSKGIINAFEDNVQ